MYRTVYLWCLWFVSYSVNFATKIFLERYYRYLVPVTTYINERKSARWSVVPYSKCAVMRFTFLLKKRLPFGQIARPARPSFQKKLKRIGHQKLDKKQVSWIIISYLVLKLNRTQRKLEYKYDIEPKEYKIHTGADVRQIKSTKRHFLSPKILMHF